MRLIEEDRQMDGLAEGQVVEIEVDCLREAPQYMPLIPDALEE